MTTFHRDNDHLFALAPHRRPVAVALVNPERAAAILAERGLTYAIAQAIASGALATVESTREIARWRGLTR